MNKNSDLVIFVSTYGYRCIKTTDGIPIEVGAFGRENFVYKLHDDSGCNISKENKYYGELTGLYWVWKNYDKSQIKYIGYSHYNKKLAITRKEIKEYLSTNEDGWIVAKKASVAMHSDKCEWKIFVEVINDMYPEYYDYFKKIYGEYGESDCCNTLNMYITTVEEFDKYCEFLFDILAEIRRRIGDNEKHKYDQRYCAFFAERILTWYLLVNKKRIKEVKVKRKLNKKRLFHLILKGIPFMTKTKLYEKLRRRYRLDWADSSYFK